MELAGEHLIFSASDLNTFLECPYSARLELMRARGELASPDESDPVLNLLRRKGYEHESAYLQLLRSEGREVVIIPQGQAGVAATLEAMRAGAQVIHQAAFVDEDWRGYADFLFRVPGESTFGPWEYEAADTKLARAAKPYFLLQLCFYSERLAHLQGTWPEHVHLILGDGRTERYRRADFDAFYRCVRDRFAEEMRTSASDAYPLPCEHCSVCEWQSHCRARWETDDHLCQVANVRRSQILRLTGAGVTTMADLAVLGEPRVKGIGAGTLAALCGQARLQVAHRETGEHRYVLLPPDGRERGFALLPPPSEGDIFFDMEGNPYADAGLEYLFGVVTVRQGEPEYHYWWAHDRAEEKRALEGFVDFVTERLARNPDLHIYHYAAYEPTALKRLMGAHGTREEEIDALLRNRVLVDLYTIVRQAIRVSQPSYSIKKLEPFYMEERQGAIASGDESVVAYEEWIQTGKAEILEQIRAYNEADCVSTWKLRDWLRERAAEAAVIYPPPPPPQDVAEEPAAALSEEELPDGTPSAGEERERLRAALILGIPDDPVERTPDQQARWLLAQLLEWHRREEKPEWWAFFDRQAMTPEELVDDADCIGLLAPSPGAPESDRRSLIHTLTFPSQEHKIGPGAQVMDWATGKRAGTVIDVDGVEGTLRLKRGPSLRDTPLPVAILPPGPLNNKVLRDSLLSLAASVVESPTDHEAVAASTSPTSQAAHGSHAYRAARDLLLAAPPRVQGHTSGTSLADPAVDPVEEAIRLVRGLDESVLFIQGPPGSGKTYAAARMIVELMRDGRRVGVTSNSHKAIHNLLEEVELRAAEIGFAFRGVQKATNDETAFDGDCIEAVRDNVAVEDRIDSVSLVAGTAWLFGREQMKSAVDYLFVDEAGQVSLANALAVASAARNLVLVGDPMQLSQPMKGAHPEGAGVSVLEHLLGDEPATVGDDRGMFLAHSRRMHPGVCAFISEAMYEGRLRPYPGNERQEIAGIGAGLRFIGVEHEGNAQRSEEEAVKVRDEIKALLGREFTPKEGHPRRIDVADILVVAPYNAQVHCLRQFVPDGVRVGTVDKFQGQEAPVVFFSMTTSSPEELPHSLEFLFSRNRLNVAVSRAQCLAVVTASPRLLTVKCRTVEQMRMVNALCRFVEMAQGRVEMTPGT
ncbi:MAG: TM0106 family RecB-like putative nuclease [Actinomycetota bacterium]